MEGSSPSRLTRLFTSLGAHIGLEASEGRAYAGELLQAVVGESSAVHNLHISINQRTVFVPDYFQKVGKRFLLQLELLPEA